MSLVRKPAGRLRWLYRSSTMRLTFLLSLIFAIGMSVAVFVALSFGRDALIDRVDQTLANLAVGIQADDDLENIPAVIIKPVEDLDELPREFSRIVQRGRGTVSLDRRFNRSEEWRALIARDDDGERVLIALPLDDSEDALDLLSSVLWTTVATVLAIVILIGLIVGYFAQRRLVLINRTLDRLASGDLKQRTGIVSGNDDIADLAQQVDKSAAEIERLVAQTQHLSASIAHDLRTPLARLRAHVESLPDGQLRSAALDEATQLAEIFDTIMRVARIEAGQGIEGFENVDIAALIEELGETFGPVVEDAGKKLSVETSKGNVVFADRKMLVQAIANLIQNALVHGGANILLFADHDMIGVSDDGIGVPVGQLEEIIKPMVRLDAARGSEGSGLGLAMVRAIADRHGAALQLSNNKPHGLRAALKFA